MPLRRDTNFQLLFSVLGNTLRDKSALRVISKAAAVMAKKTRYQFQAGGKPSTWCPPGELVDQTLHTDQDFHKFQDFQKFQIFMIFMKIMHHLRTESPQNIKNPHNVCVYD